MRSILRNLNDVYYFIIRKLQVWLWPLMVGTSIFLIVGSILSLKIISEEGDKYHFVADVKTIPSTCAIGDTVSYSFRINLIGETGEKEKDNFSFRLNGGKFLPGTIRLIKGHIDPEQISFNSTQTEFTLSQVSNLCYDELVSRKTLAFSARVQIQSSPQAREEAVNGIAGYYDEGEFIPFDLDQVAQSIISTQASTVSILAYGEEYLNQNPNRRRCTLTLQNRNSPYGQIYSRETKPLQLIDVLDSYASIDPSSIRFSTEQGEVAFEVVHNTLYLNGLSIFPGEKITISYEVEISEQLGNEQELTHQIQTFISSPDGQRLLKI